MLALAAGVARQNAALGRVRGDEPPPLSPGMLGALVGGGVGAVVVCCGGVLLALLCGLRLGKGKASRFAEMGDDERQVHITLHAGPGGLTASGGQATEAQQMLAAALGKALEMGPIGEASQSASPAPHGTPAVHRVD
jgi:hypothetical protein